MPETTRILLVEDHPLIRAGCRRLLAQRRNFDLQEADRGLAALELNKRHRPDILLLDLDLPDGNGLDLMPQLVADNAPVRIIILSMYGDSGRVSRALAKGAKGYVTKNDDPAAILTAIDKVLEGEVYLGQTVAQALALTQLQPETPGLAELGEREKAILDGLGDGKSLAEIAADLGVTYKTVANAAGLLKSKLRIRTSAALVKFAVERKSA
ncbi:response regulator [Dongia sedimenti]|uniref:Response regulator transcription factor n=1 Tax=Dongia sedimenti TaxID=3064282 RepID=A0ABU0YMT4_9PROT|nr:response regulator transcription factor [Rhodospirillaceae bacterium R-7]